MELQNLTINIKLFDSKTFSLQIPSNVIVMHFFQMLQITVSKLKEKIASVSQIPANQQRLIFQGRVLRDEKTIAESCNHYLVSLIRTSNTPRFHSFFSSIKARAITAS